MKNRQPRSGVYSFSQVIRILLLDWLFNIQDMPEGSLMFLCIYICVYICISLTYSILGTFLSIDTAEITKMKILDVLSIILVSKISAFKPERRDERVTSLNYRSWSNSLLSLCLSPSPLQKLADNFIIIQTILVLYIRYDRDSHCVPAALHSFIIKIRDAPQKSYFN